MSIVFLRTIILYLLIIFALRFMGKRQIGELQPSELVVTIMISNIAAMPIENTNIPILGGFIPIFTLICLEVIISYFGTKSMRFRELTTGSPKIIIKGGVIEQSQMSDLRLSASDLVEETRQKDIFDIRDIEFAIVETNGKISIKKKSDSMAPPLVPVISNGTIIKNGLKFCGVSKEWLFNVLSFHKLQSNEVFLMLCDPSQNYHIVKKEKTT